MAVKNLGQVSAIFSGATAPTNTALIWRDTSQTPAIYMVYNSVSGMWENIATQGILDRELTINGTTDKITVSGGTQNLSADRTWTVTISATYAGQASISTLGTISTGVWQGTSIADAYIATSSNWNTAYTHSQLTSGNPHSVTKSDVGLSNVENTALSTWAGSSNLTTLGTIISGTWNGTAISSTYVGNLPASKITSGTFADARISESNVTQHQAALSITESQISDFQSYQLLSQRGAANGYAPLDSGAVIPVAYLPDFILGQLVYGGTFNASTALATLSDSAKSKLGTAASTITLTNNTTAITGYVDNEGIYYVTTNSGTFAGISFVAGDWLISNGSAWEKVDNTDAVTSVFGRMGAVVANEADYQAYYPRLSQSYVNPSWIISLNYSKITGGSSSQFVKADGSVDNNTYALNSALGNYLPLTGGTLTGSLTGTLATFTGGGIFNANTSITTSNVSTSLFIETTAASGRNYRLFSAASGSALGNAGDFVIRDDTAGANRFVIDSSGDATFSGDIIKDIEGTTRQLRLISETSGNPLSSLLGADRFSGFSNNLTSSGTKVSSTLNGSVVGLSDGLLRAYYISSSTTPTGAEGLRLDTSNGNLGIAGRMTVGNLSGVPVNSEEFMVQAVSGTFATSGVYRPNSTNGNPIGGFGFYADTGDSTGELFARMIGLSDDRDTAAGRDGSIYFEVYQNGSLLEVLRLNSTGSAVFSGNTIANGGTHIFGANDNGNNADDVSNVIKISNGSDSGINVISDDSNTWGSYISFSQVDGTVFENKWTIRRKTNGDGDGDGSLNFIYGTSVASTGNTIVASISTTGDITANDFVQSSDVRGKEVLTDLGHGFIKYKRKGSDQVRIGTTTQYAEEYAPETVREGKDGYNELSYIDFLCAKVAELESKLVELENGSTRH